jgi:uncharacterized protein HemX
MDMGSFKALELALIVGVVGYFYIRQRRNLHRLKEEREAKQAENEQETRTSAANRSE